MTGYDYVKSEVLSKVLAVSPELEITDRGIEFPVYWYEDDNGNINFDIESMKDEFARFITNLESFNN